MPTLSLHQISNTENNLLASVSLRISIAKAFVAGAFTTPPSKSMVLLPKPTKIMSSHQYISSAEKVKKHIEMFLIP